MSAQAGSRRKNTSMLEVKTRRELRECTRNWRQNGQRIALVPTMGNLHAGHLALVKAARDQADRVLSSIYVNPAQFAEGEDIESYPRTLEADRVALAQTGCDLLFAPHVHTVYPFGFENAVMLGAAPDLAAVLEGRFRPGHFDGVVTVVARLFNLVQPDVAVFGEKDYQQLLIIRRMVEDLGYDIHIHAVPTVREHSGLALSSRNSYLDREQLERAQCLQAVLKDTAARAGQTGVDLSLLEDMAEIQLKKHQLDVEYVAIRRAQDLAVPGNNDQNLRLLAAVRCGKTRLIDNLRINRACNNGG
jgi:pantoate--beta-alanine ligase